MKLRNLRYFLSESLKSMVRNRLMSLASIITVASCALIFAISYSVIININQMVAAVERNMAIVVFIEDEATYEDVEALNEQLLSLYYVVGTNFITPAEALDSLAMTLPEGMLDGVGDVLMRSFEVEITDLYSQAYVIEEIEALNHVYRVLQDQEAVDIVIGISRGISIIGVVTILFLALISTVIIINTIKITVAAREHEINIMKYVGATDWFIRWPFLMEGILIGLFGAILALITSYFMYIAVLNATSTGLTAAIFEMALFEMAEIGGIFLVLIPVSILMGIVIGVIGSVSSIRKYLRV